MCAEIDKAWAAAKAATRGSQCVGKKPPYPSRPKRPFKPRGGGSGIGSASRGIRGGVGEVGIGKGIGEGIGEGIGGGIRGPGTEADIGGGNLSVVVEEGLEWGLEDSPDEEELVDCM